MANFIRSSKQNPCPICNRTKDGDCTVTTNGEMVMCHSIQDGIGDYDTSKWFYRGQTDIWGQFILKTVTAEKFVKPIQPKSSKDYFYPHFDEKPLVKVTRRDDGMGKKSFSQSHWNGKKWVSGNPDHIRPLIPIYRAAEVFIEIRRENQIFIVEGESTADALWEIGMPATTTIGGSGGYEKYGSYLECFADARLVLCPDRDAAGLKYMANFVRDFPDQIEGYYLAGTTSLWKNPDGGMDIANDLADRGYSKQQVIDRIISPAEFESMFAVDEVAIDEPESERPKFTTSVGEGLRREAMELLPDGSFKRVRKLIGNHIEAIAYVENIERGGTGILIEFFTQRGKLDRVLIPRVTLNGDGTDALKFLVDLGYHYQRPQKQKLLDYLFELGSDVERVYSIADRTGWVNGSFLTPAKTYGDPNLRFREPEPDNSFIEIKGTLDDWKREVASKCDGNSRLIFSMGTVFAAPLLDPCQIESGGFHLTGTTSIGKTTALNVAAGVAGLKNVPNWRSTSNALEGKASEFNHSLLPLDELGQADAQTVGASAYMLGNGQGKSRMAKTLTTVKPKTWELLFLSSGEFAMTEYLRQAKIVVKGGMEARMPSIPADLFKGWGIFETIHGHEISDTFVVELEGNIRKYRGTALDAYLTQLVTERQSEGFDKQLRERVHSIANSLSQQFNDSAIGRVAVRFALVQVGLELAHSFNLLPFPRSQCEWAISKMFEDWVRSRGGGGSIEIKEACNKIEYLFVSNQHNIDRIAEATSPNGCRNLLAYRSGDSVTDEIEFWVPPPIFNKEFADGIDKTQIIKELQARGWLKPSVDKHFAIRRRIGGQQQRFYVFSKFWGEENLDRGVFGGSEKAVDSVDSVDSPPNNGSMTEFPLSPLESTPKNTSGLSGLSTNVPESTESTRKNSVDSQWTQHQSAPGAGLNGVSPLSPLSPLEKHTPQIASKNNYQFKVSDLVKYVGNNPSKASQYTGTFTVYEIEEAGFSCSGLLPDGKVSSWIDFDDLELVAAYQKVSPDIHFWHVEGDVLRASILFEKHAIAKKWLAAISLVFGFYGVLEKIEQSDNNYKWRLAFSKFNHDAIDKLIVMKLWLDPDAQDD